MGHHQRPEPGAQHPAHPRTGPPPSCARTATTGSSGSGSARSELRTARGVRSSAGQPRSSRIWCIKAVRPSSYRRVRSPEVQHCCAPGPSRCGADLAQRHRLARLSRTFSGMGGGSRSRGGPDLRRGLGRQLEASSRGCRGRSLVSGGRPWVCRVGGAGSAGDGDRPGAGYRALRTAPLTRPERGSPLACGCMTTDYSSASSSRPTTSPRPDQRRHRGQDRLLRRSRVPPCSR